MDTFEICDITCNIAGVILGGDVLTRPTMPTSGWSRRSNARSTIYCLCDVRGASGPRRCRVAPEGYEEQTTTGVLIRSGIGGIEGIAETAVALHERGPRRVSPFFIPGRIINLASGFVSIAFGLKGPNHAVVTACSTGAHAIGDAARLVALGDAEVMVAGGAESPVNRISLAGFSRVARAFDQFQR